MLYIPPTNFLLLAAKQEPNQKDYLLMKNTEEVSGKKSGECASRQEKRRDRKSNRTQKKNKWGDSKVESNDSPEIPDRGETSDIPSLPSGVKQKTQSQLFSLSNLYFIVIILYKAKSILTETRRPNAH